MLEIYEVELLKKIHFENQTNYSGNSLYGWFTIPCVFITFIGNKNWTTSVQQQHFCNFSCFGVTFATQFMGFNQSCLIHHVPAFISRICCQYLVSAHFVCLLLVSAWQEFLPCCADNLTLVQVAHVPSLTGPLGSAMMAFWQHQSTNQESSPGWVWEKAVYLL